MKFKVKNNIDSTEIYVTGDIMDDSWKGWSWGDDIETYPSDIRNLLDGADGKDVKVYINSGGGDLFAGVAISNMLARHEGRTTAIVDGLAASAASIIAFGCDDIEIPSNAYIMIHKPAVGIYGNSDELLKWADTLDELQKGIVKTYAKKAVENITEEQINSLVDEETWMTGEKAKEFFNVKITDNVEISQDVGNCVMNYQKTPKIFKSYEPKEDLERKRKEIEIAMAIN